MLNDKFLGFHSLKIATSAHTSRELEDYIFSALATMTPKSFSFPNDKMVLSHWFSFWESSFFQYPVIKRKFALGSSAIDRWGLLIRFPIYFNSSGDKRLVYLVQFNVPTDRVC